MKSIDPATGKVIKSYAEYSVPKTEGILRETEHAFGVWHGFSFKERALVMINAARFLRKNRERYARLMANEMGKPFAQGIQEIEKCAGVCDFYARHAGRFLSDEFIRTDAARSYVRYAPLGIVLAVMPWNFPFWQVFRCAAPTLMAGNAMVLKHASNVCGCALAIEEVFKTGGFPSGLFRTVLVGGSKVERLIRHPLVRAVTLTGSTGAGKAVAAAAGAVVKKTVLELGGSDPYLVLADADLEQAVQTCVASRLINAGQSCVAAKRFIVVNKVLKKFEELFVQNMRSQRMGPPLEDGVTLGPLARHDLRGQVHAQVQKSVKAGACVLLGGRIPQGPGAFYPPTVLGNVCPGMPAYNEEIFGPVASLIAVRDEREGIRAANDTVFGLGAAVFTRDLKRGERIAAQELQAGSCFVNDFVRSDPRLPFGGIKQSGYGRELSVCGSREFVNIKTVHVGKTPSLK